MGIAGGDTFVLVTSAMVVAAAPAPARMVKPAHMTAMQQKGLSLAV